MFQYDIGCCLRLVCYVTKAIVIPTGTEVLLCCMHVHASTCRTRTRARTLEHQQWAPINYEYSQRGPVVLRHAAGPAYRRTGTAPTCTRALQRERWPRHGGGRHRHRSRRGARVASGASGRGRRAPWPRMHPLNRRRRAACALAPGPGAGRPDRCARGGFSCVCITAGAPHGCAMRRCRCRAHAVLWPRARVRVCAPRARGRAWGHAGAPRLSPSHHRGLKIFQLAVQPHIHIHASTRA